MQKKLNWQAYSREDRNKTIEEVKEVISASEGYILNFNMFSDLAMSLSIEIEESGIAELHVALSRILKVSEFDEKNINCNSSKEWIIFVNISFKDGKGDLKRILPAVPG